MSVAPLLVFGWGNPSRGDDALGPLFVEGVAALALPGVECLTDFQLQVEHALDLRGRERLLFVDAARADGLASADGLTSPDRPFELWPLEARRDASYTTHAMSAAALLQVYADVEGHAPPPAWQLAIRGQDWALGAAPSPAGLAHLQQALHWARHQLLQTWHMLSTNR